MTLNELKSQPLAPLLLQRFGYTVVRDKDSRQWRCLESPSGLKILVKSSPNRRSGHYLYKSVQDETGGSIVDLLVNHHGLTFREVLERFDALTPSPKTAYKEPDEPKYLTLREVNWHLKTYSSKSPNYLIGRGITLATQQFFKVRSNAQGAIFPLYDLQSGQFKPVCLWERRTCPRFPRLFKGAKGAGVSIFGTKNDYDTACVFESPIDALSYFELFTPSNTLLISLCGNPSLAQKKGLRAKIAHFGIKKVQICLDNDKAGDDQEKALLKRSETSHKLVYLDGLEVSRLKPNGKDWNEDLLRK